MRTPQESQDILENMEELINKQKKEIASLKEQLKREQRCTDFYANKKNVNQMCNGVGDDYEEIDGIFHGGKLARATQARREK